MSLCSLLWLFMSVQQHDSSRVAEKEETCKHLITTWGNYKRGKIYFTSRLKKSRRSDSEFHFRGIHQDQSSSSPPSRCFSDDPVKVEVNSVQAFLRRLHWFAVLPGCTNTNAITWRHGEERGGRPNPQPPFSFRWTWLRPSGLNLRLWMSFSEKASGLTRRGSTQ